jgi:alkanesulfonate monooxygenase SsuD/methylene tetrahydromethanopterin reductase-like flavin-dependent oxidoreductase (luciferase family)
MNLGLFMMPVHPPEKSRTQCFEEDIELIVRIEELGFTEAWIGQHHTVAWEPIPANDLFIANLLPRTHTIRLGTGVSILPQHHPANVAVRLAFLDHLSRGRLNCGFGQGGVPTDHELFDLPDGKTQGLMTMEAIDMILKLWELEAPFDIQGKFWRLRIQSAHPEQGIGTLLKPYQKPHPPIAMSVIRGQSMAAQTAAARGYIPISTNLVHPNTLKEHWETYSQAAQDAGRATGRDIWRVSRSIFVADSTREAWAHCMNGTFGRALCYVMTLLKASNMLHIMKEDPSLPDSDVTLEYVLKNLCIIGDPMECTRQLHGLKENIGSFGTLLMIAHDWDDKSKWLRSMDLLVNEVKYD